MMGRNYEINCWTDYFRFFVTMEGKSITESATESIKVEPMLSGKIDNYNGVIVDSKSLPADRDKFEAILKGITRLIQDNFKASLATWNTEGRRGIWIEIPKDKSELVPVAIKVKISLVLNFLARI